LPGVPSFLISEAVRGEGAVLVNDAGERFMLAVDERAELAPRDIVARAIVAEMARTGTDRVFLDVTHLPPERTLSRFPQIAAFCLQHGIDITKEPIPVSPAAHYMMGGVKTNSWGETNIRSLYACGEVACTGVHGANRLASNSLLETIVFAERVVRRTVSGQGGPTLASPHARELPVARRMGAYTPEDGSPTRIGAPARALPFAEAPLSLENLQALMWDKAGIVRDGPGLAQASLTLSMWQHSYHATDDRPSQELSNLLLVARLLTEAALIRQESRGAHYRTDFPHTSDSWKRHLVFREDRQT
jgi:L-aspartate oxidase